MRGEDGKVKGSYWMSYAANCLISYDTEKGKGRSLQLPPPPQPEQFAPQRARSLQMRDGLKCFRGVRVSRVLQACVHPSFLIKCPGRRSGPEWFHRAGTPSDAHGAHALPDPRQVRVSQYKVAKFFLLFFCRASGPACHGPEFCMRVRHSVTSI